MIQSVRDDLARMGLAVMILLVCNGGTGATTIRVEADGSGDVPTIVDAIVAASDGDEIELGDGTFSGPGNRDIDFLGKGVRVYSASGDASACVIDCGGSESEPHRGFILQSEEGGFSILESITITHGYVTDDLGGGGILTVRSAPQLIRCRIVANHSEGSGGGLRVLGKTDTFDAPIVMECQVLANSAWAGGGISDSGGIWMSDCLVAGNRAQIGGGIESSAPLLIDRSTVVGNWGESEGGGVHSSSGTTFRAAALWSNCSPVGPDGFFSGTLLTEFECSIVDVGRLDGGGSIELLNVVSADPEFCQPVSCMDAPTADGDYEVSEDSACLPDHNPCGVLIGCCGVGCTSVPVQRRSWGSIKTSFR